MDEVRILVVDDYQSIANALCRTLRAQGHEARAVYSGQAALDEAATFDPQLVLLDIVLPDMTGYDVARELRARAPGPLYIAAISTRKEVLDENIDELAQKPFGLERLSQILVASLRRAAT